ncbi:hypothetical protein EV702DRAFT_1049024 [Suillus placidus]|uniref:Uncharacterized protein n=1 Tax=Suillus placidus TaxID=48579 RepID=A0A9P7CYI2_9AGAM|nr:hypothetical protein EV702DRAFT_1049024 [Suillus placidus]
MQSSPEYNFNFPTPLSYGPPAVLAGHPYGRMVGAHGVEAHGVYPGGPGPGGMPGGCPVSAPATTLVPSHCPEFERPSSVLPVVDPRLSASISGSVGPSGSRETNGGSQKLKVLQVLSQMATINQSTGSCGESGTATRTGSPRTGDEMCSAYRSREE